ncbi:spastin [Anaeramoeba ignava]|uniref:microtubule-severing ATPase n=1 Tax=Anaeramoeba ignava TaxID=1746090 RepID=A0A9Q0LUP2_ANAIG|nr:spastin [Anaeramoeba ignava]
MSLIPTPIQKFSSLQSTAYHLVDIAINQESSAPDSALKNYLDAQEIMNKALGLRLLPNDYQQISQSISKMHGILEQITERIIFLSQKLSTSKQSNSPKNFRKSPNQSNQNLKQAQQKKPTAESQKLIDQIENEIIDNTIPVKWDDIVGLEYPKQALKELIILPSLRPDLFQGLRSPPKGLLLFGPPGNGKTMLARATAYEAHCTFFSISASSLTSKWVGEGEKLVRTLFQVARQRQPSVVFIDEIDSILTKRTENENESSRRLKTEFLIQLDGATTDPNERLLVMAATNRPQDLDDAALRRFSKRVFVPLPDKKIRTSLIQRLMKDQSNNLSKQNFSRLAKITEGFSSSDITALCKEAAMEPIRNVDISNISVQDIRKITIKDFENALKIVRPSCSKALITELEKWSSEFGIKLKIILILFKKNKLFFF